MVAIEKPSSHGKRQRTHQNDKIPKALRSNFQIFSRPAFDNVAGALGSGKEIKNGDGWLTCCPVHGDANPSLSIALNNEGKLIVNCHAGCDWRIVMEEIRKMDLLSGTRSTRGKNNLPAYIWNKSIRNEKMIKAYLATRNIYLNQIPEAIRWNKYKEQMLVARVSEPAEGKTLAIHRTFLGDKLQKTDRKMLGPCKGRAVWLSDPQIKMIVGEGIETTLSAMEATNLPGVACLSAIGMKIVKIPKQVKKIIILVDSDQNHVGQGAARNLAQRFEGEAYFATPCDSCFTPHPEKMDFNDLDQEQIRYRFEKLITISELVEPATKAEISLLDEDGKPKAKATILIEIGSQYELFHDETGESYATITIDGHWETWPLKSSFFSELLADQYFLLSNKGVSRNVVTDAIDTLRGKARNHGKKHKVYRRTAALDGKIFIDLCDSDWRAVEVTKDSWRVVANPEIKFLRSPSSKALPLPLSDGNINDLWPLINVKPADRPLVAGFLVRALQPNSPYFGLCVIGEQGTGKSTFTTMLRHLCDPSTAMLRPPPKDDRDFLAGAVNNWCLTYDNLSGMPPWLSDSLCRILTGGSFAARTLYSTTEETTIPLERPAILNGIDDLTARPDLADRVIVINLQPINDSERIEERLLWKKFSTIYGKVFGVLLDGVSSALKNINSVELPYKPRMVDAAKWATAAEDGLGFLPGSFMKSYADNQKDMVSVSLETSPFIAALLDMAKDKKQWEGTPTNLLSLLTSYARDEDAVRSKAWPKSPPWVTRTLRRYAPALRKIGVEVESSRNDTGGHIRITMKRMTVKLKNLTPHGERYSENQEDENAMSDVQLQKNAVITVSSPDSNDGNDSNDGRIQKMSEEANRYIEVEL